MAAGADPNAKQAVLSAVGATQIVARAEFRVFGHGIIDIVRTRMWAAHAVLQGVRSMPPETYLLSALSDAANVKVRDGLLDIKLKTGTTPQGYELFQPSGKFAFPVKREELAGALSELKVSIDLTEETYSLETVIAIARGCRGLVPVTVEKTRYGFLVDGVICEYAEVWFNGALLESACCESEDYTAVAKAVEVLELSAFEHVNYLEAAKRVVGMARRFGRDKPL
jgi:hypothetical protein